MSQPVATRASIYILSSGCRQQPPVFLAPSLLCPFPAHYHRSHFSTSTPVQHRRRKGANPDRGVSALRRTGPRFAFGMSKYPLPQPVLDPLKRSEIKVDEKHGLWGFFNQYRQLLTQPRDEIEHGMYILSTGELFLRQLMFFTRSRLDSSRASKKVVGGSPLPLVGVL